MKKMKHVMSVSLGSSKRNHRSEIQLLGEKFLLERVGTDGDPKKMKQLFEEFDGKVDAFGLGGFDLYLNYKNRRYTFREAYQVTRGIQKTPLADGSGVKKTLECMSIHYLHDKGLIQSSMKVLVPSAVSRYHLFDTFKQLGYQVKWGDIPFALGLGKRAHSSLFAMDLLAFTLLPLMVRLPFKWLYPVGEDQDTTISKFDRLYQEADIIAGDFHYIYRYLPASIKDKIIITNTLTADETLELKKRGARMIATTTPNFGGRSFATNVIEALVCAMLNKKPDSISAQEFIEIFHRINFEPSIIRFDQEKS
jgi:hypothetical protein